jgi:5-(carboxyamino)imidazole ribonucleotide synthase
MTAVAAQPQVILPGQTIGIFGGGQLGRMLAIVARRSGYRVHVFTNEENAPASHFANQVTVAADDDEKNFRAFASSIDVLTFEFENVSAQSLQWVPPQIPVRPGGNVFWTAQHRQREKQFLRENQIPLPKFASVESLEQLRQAVIEIGLPAVLKTSAGGYDGKGQFLLESADQIETAWSAVDGRACTLEVFIDLACEISVIVARDIFGTMAVYGPIENQHANHILDLSFCPSRVDAAVASQALEIARKVTTAFELVGLICIEYFVTTRGEVLVNELAPRPHNSGHLTIESFATCQFEQQLRAICGLPLGSTLQIRPAAMVNLLGDLWFPPKSSSEDANRSHLVGKSFAPVEPNWKVIFDHPQSYLHLYDKPQSRIGRKMGHLTVCADAVEVAQARAIAIRENLRANAFKPEF